MTQITTAKHWLFNETAHAISVKQWKKNLHDAFQTPQITDYEQKLPSESASAVPGHVPAWLICFIAPRSSRGLILCDSAWGVPLQMGKPGQALPGWLKSMGGSRPPSLCHLKTDRYLPQNSGTNLILPFVATAKVTDVCLLSLCSTINIFMVSQRRHLHCHEHYYGFIT